MSFSVIIATLGRPDVLARTLARVDRCHPAPDELIVVDGDPGRSSEKATTGEHPYPLRYMTSSPGLPKQRNAGMDRASGDVIVFIDDDVNLPLDTFAVLERAYSDPTLLGATARIVEPPTARIGKKHSPVRKLLPGGGGEGSFTRFGYPRRLVDLETERDIEFMHGSFMSVRSSVAREVRFDERLPGYALAEDEDFSYRLSRRGRIRYLPSLSVIHAKEGHGSRDARAFGRTLVVNRSYLFRKNFPRSPLARLQFVGLIGLFVLHRLVNREWAEAVGLIEGSVRALGRPLEADVKPNGTGSPRVVFVSSHARAGGSERYLETLLSHLDPARVAGVVSLEGGPFVEALRASGHDVRVVPTGGGFGAILRSSLVLRRHLRSIEADLVHANGIKAALACVLAGPRLPLLWVKHDFSFDGWLVRFVARRCAAIVGVSEAVLRALPGDERAKATVVYNGIETPTVDRDAARRALCEELSVTEDVRLVGLVGRMHPVKGHEDLIAAVGTIEHERSVHLVLVGGPDPSFPGLSEHIRTAAAALGEERVHFLGHRADALKVMSGLDVAAMPSHREGGADVEAFPLTALELLACGTPVVAYSSGGLPELLGECGVLVPTGDVTALGRALGSLLADPDRARSLSECGRARVDQHFSLSQTIEKMDEIYEWLASSR